MSSKNPGKLFEEDFRDSVPKDVYYLRLHDSAIGFDVKNSTQRFSLKSPYDCILCHKGQMWCFELKSTKGNSISFDGHTPKIKMRQVEELIKAEKAGAKCYLALNFRSKDETVLIDPVRFKTFTEEAKKKSINLEEAESIGIKLNGKKKRIRTRYDLEALITG